MEEKIDNFNCFNQEFINLSSHNDKKRKSGKTNGQAMHLNGISAILYFL